MTNDVRIICALAIDSEYEDDVIGACGDCGVMVCHRPHIPRPSTLLCLDCAEQYAQLHLIDEVLVTPESAAEFAAWLRRRLH